MSSVFTLMHLQVQFYSIHFGDQNILSQPLSLHSKKNHVSKEDFKRFYGMNFDDQNFLNNPASTYSRKNFDSNHSTNSSIKTTTFETGKKLMNYINDLS